MMLFLVIRAAVAVVVALPSPRAAMAAAAVATPALLLASLEAVAQRQQAVSVWYASPQLANFFN